jgi:hypothetical protein
VRLTDGTAVDLAQRVPLAEALRCLRECRDSGRKSDRAHAGGGGGQQRSAEAAGDCGAAGAGGEEGEGEELEEDDEATRPWYMMPPRSAHAARAMGSGSAHARKAAAEWLFDGDNRLSLPGSLHRISAVVGRAGHVAGLTYRVGRHVKGVAAPLTDILLHMAAAHRGAARGTCFRGAVTGGGMWAGGGSGGGVGSPSLLLLGRPGTGKVQAAAAGRDGPVGTAPEHSFWPPAGRGARVLTPVAV